jgi:hypothetical protein
MLSFVITDSNIRYQLTAFEVVRAVCDGVSVCASRRFEGTLCVAEECQARSGSGTRRYGVTEHWLAWEVLAIPLGLLEPEDESTASGRNVGKYSVTSH